MSTAAIMEWCVLVKGVPAGLVKGRFRWHVLQRESNAGADTRKSAGREGVGVGAGVAVGVSTWPPHSRQLHGIWSVPAHVPGFAPHICSDILTVHLPVLAPRLCSACSQGQSLTLRSSVVPPTSESSLDWKSLRDYIRIDCGECLVSNTSRLNISIHLV